jgi:hypothetical protein
MLQHCTVCERLNYDSDQAEPNNPTLIQSVLLSDLCRLYWALYRRLQMAELQAGQDVPAHSQDEMDGLPRWPCIRGSQAGRLSDRPSDL